MHTSPSARPGLLLVDQSLALPVRAILGVSGAVTLLAPLSLASALWPVTPLTPMFAAIVLVALAIGGCFAAAALAAPSVRWRLIDRGLHVEHRALLYRWQRTYTKTDVAGLQLLSGHDIDGNATFTAQVELRSGDRLTAPGHADRRQAEAQIEALRTQLRL